MRISDWSSDVCSSDLPINQFFPSRLIIDEAGHSRIEFSLDENFYHAAGAVHGTSYFKMLDDAAFYAANSLVSDRFLLTTAFNLLFTKPLTKGPVVAEGRWISGKRDRKSTRLNSSH